MLIPNCSVRHTMLSMVGRIVDASIAASSVQFFLVTSLRMFNFTLAGAAAAGRSLAQLRMSLPCYYLY